MVKKQEPKRKRRRALNSRTKKRYCDALASGLVQELAAQKAGVTGRTIRKWLAHGNQLLDQIDDGDLRADSLKGFDRQCVELVLESELASCEMDDLAVSVVKQAMLDGDAKAAFWWLEHVRAHYYGRYQTIRHEGIDQEPLINALKDSLGNDPRAALGLEDGDDNPE